MLSEVLRQLAQSRPPASPVADPSEVQEALRRFDPLWVRLTAWEQETFIRTLVSQVRYDGTKGTVTVGFRSEGIKEICAREEVTA